MLLGVDIRARMGVFIVMQNSNKYAISVECEGYDWTKEMLQIIEDVS
jgi:hypothetical protein